jgi:hypothetical protein
MADEQPTTEVRNEASSTEMFDEHAYLERLPRITFAAMWRSDLVCEGMLVNPEEIPLNPLEKKTFLTRKFLTDPSVLVIAATSTSTGPITLDCMPLLDLAAAVKLKPRMAAAILPPSFSEERFDRMITKAEHNLEIREGVVKLVFKDVVEALATGAIQGFVVYPRGELLPPLILLEDRQIFSMNKKKLSSRQERK